MRKIVVLRPREPLTESFRRRSFDAAANLLENEIAVPGVSFFPEYSATRVPILTSDRKATSAGDGFTTELGHNYAVVAEFDDPEAEQRLLNERAADTVGIYADPEIGAFPVVCPGSSSVGSVNDVKNQIRIAALHAAGLRGNGVKIAVVDGGIDGTQINVSGGLNRPGFPAPGTSAPDHGTMVAFDSLIAAPNAMIFDFPLLRSAGGLWVGFLSDAIRIFAELLVLKLQAPGPLVVVNSWGMYDRSQDAPVGDPQNYSANPAHPFNQIVGSLVGTGLDVLFAAGNCGSTCPVSRCGANDRGPGNSIHGGNSHPDAISVAAVTVHDDLLGYSSEGPGALHPQKPDLAGSSHFLGSGINGRPDTGTSAACPVVAGVVAALRAKPSARTISPLRLKSALLQSARQTTVPVSWNAQTGWGILDAQAALALV